MLQPYERAMVLVKDGPEIIEREMLFSLIPPWALKPRVSFATHLARLKDGSAWIYERRLWKEPFKKRHCLLVLESSTLPRHIAGIWGEWSQMNSVGNLGNPMSKIISFAILTDNDRPIELRPESHYEWLAVSDSIRKPKHWVEFLRINGE